MGPKVVMIVTHEGVPLLAGAHHRIKGTIGPGGRLETVHDSPRPKFLLALTCTLLMLLAVFVTIPLLDRIHLRVGMATPSASSGQADLDDESSSISSWVLYCGDRPCFQKELLRVPEDKPGFPSFWNYAPHGPISVSYDERAILLNSTRALFLGGSIHPARATPQIWAEALDEAVRNGLNLITIYVFWDTHQPFPDSPFDWSLPGSRSKCRPVDDDTTQLTDCEWTLASAIREAANRGLFVHARLGPYVCAEYTYGGIPEWVPLDKPTMAMRRPNQEWYDVMERFLKEAITYLSQEKLWAHQGGNIILAQVENELGDDDIELEAQHILTIEDAHEVGKRRATMQDYAEWCGKTAAKYAPDVLWTMCNGLTAKNAINTCNGIGGDCSVAWLESYGQNGRIQVDQPALWTENEGGFQEWGVDPGHFDYIWGRTAKDMVFHGLKWLARGGTHINYYMWFGGYNRGRQAAGGVTNMYANDAILCSSGERHQPKFGHLLSFHQIVIDIAQMVLETPSALFQNQTVFVIGPNGKWMVGKEQRMFLYDANGRSRGDGYNEDNELVFVENDGAGMVVAQLHLPNHRRQVVTLEGKSVVVLINGLQLFDSAAISPRMTAFKRVTTESPVDLLDWQSFLEPIGVNTSDTSVMKGPVPIEQTELMISSRLASDYAWYQTNFEILGGVQNAMIVIESQKSNAMSVYIDGKYAGTLDNHDHQDGDVRFVLELGDLSPASHQLSVLSENFGYSNEIGRWTDSAYAKTKGITGAVVIEGECQSKRCAFDLVDGSEWLSSAGLNFEKNGGPATHFDHRRGLLATSPFSSPAIWSRAHFDTPNYDVTSQSLFLDIKEGRGKIWLNGNSLGNFWNITRGDSEDYTQRYYFIPNEFLYSDGQLNQLLLFNVLGGDMRSTQLIVSGLVEDTQATLEDKVAFPTACLY